jgi:hypothetical protein
MGLLPEGKHVICPKEVAKPCKGRRSGRAPGFVVSVEVEGAYLYSSIGLYSNAVHANLVGTGLS